MRLSELKTGDSATIIKVLGHGGFRRRIMEMGFVRGKHVDVLQNAPLHDPIKYRLLEYEVSLRRSEAAMIEVITDEELQQQMTLTQTEVHATEEPHDQEAVIASRRRTINVALIGNPNSGKTSLFNAISGSHEHVGNYSGVTVDAKRGEYHYGGYHFLITDLPGTYALSAYSPEELYVRQHLVEQTPDVIINAVVASNLERNLYLTTELIDINPKMVVALNMYDELEQSGAKLDYEQLGSMLGVPMVPVVAKSGKGLERLLDTVIAVYENEDPRVRHIHIYNGPIIEQALEPLYESIRANRAELPKYFPPRYFALKLLERDRAVEQLLSTREHFATWCALRDKAIPQIETQLKEDVETALANQKYGFISGALHETYTPGEHEQQQTTHLIDALVTHKLWGLPIFFFLMWLMFYCTFYIGQYPQEWIGMAVDLIGRGVQHLLPDGILKDMLVDGVIGGVGSVIVFLPNILILYMFISFMEDSGYLARAAFIMDRIMHRIGLHGKSFIPLVMGFGCNVPAVMATRTIESRSSRLITLMITPFMSCSARLPIYILFTGVFFSASAGYVLFGIYLLGILGAVVTARLMRRFLYRVDETPFVMELPPYRIPTWRTTLSHMWDKSAQYLRKMGGMILIAAIVVWFLGYFPRTEAPDTALPTTDDVTAVTTDAPESYLVRLGHWCESVFRPLGLNWKASVAILSGVSAKEIVVSTMGVLYANDENTSLSQTLRESGDFTPQSILAMMVFILFYIPCFATLLAIRQEAGTKWAIVSIVYNTAVAWVLAWTVYHVALWL
jgi:ferrous iron transport protein B